MEATLDVKVRTPGSKGELATLRKEGKIPAVFYGKNITPFAISVSSKSFISLIKIHGANAIIDLNFKDKKKTAIVKSLQRDILTQIPIHIDFQAVSLEDEVEVLVPIHMNGVADGVKNFGGVMEFMLREIKVKALPKNIPQKISIDINTLGIGQGITIADLPKLDGVQYTQELSTLVAHVAAVVAEEVKPVDSEVSEEAVTQPEVISKGKKDKDSDTITTSISGGEIKK
jgi:large subunit ribosomal protein L25